jgi:two-component system phosphate regulon sensor histidine kinase PhoR
MLTRLFSFVFFLATGALAAIWLLPSGLQAVAAWVGLLAGGVLWVALDALRGMQVLQWLKSDELGQAPVRWGLWGNLAERVRRVARVRDQAIRESDRRLQDFLAALQASPNGVVLLDAHGRIEWFNQTAAAHFGLDSQRDQLQHLVNLVRDPAFTSYVSTGDFRGSVAMPGRHHDASHPQRLSVQLHAYGEGRRLLLSRDITMFEQAEAMRRDFVANVSHEIRTPLTVLSGFVETLQTLALNEAERSRYLDLMAQQAERMQSLVSDLLTLSRLEGSPLPGTSEWLSVPLLMRQLEQDARALSEVLYPVAGEEGGQRLVFSQGPALELAGIPSELHSALSNLVSNAVRYTPADGEVRCGWSVLEDARAEFWVRDSGPGIAPEHIPRLTERFYRIDRSRSRDTGGTGLGLAIVKHVVQRHGAELRIESMVGRGSRFAIIFPGQRLRVTQAEELASQSV